MINEGQWGKGVGVEGAAALHCRRVTKESRQLKKSEVCEERESVTV